MIPEDEISLDEGPAPEGDSAIDRLRPGSPLHAKVLEQLQNRIQSSERKMGQFYSRWRANEYRYQAYMHAKDVEDLRKAANETGKPPEVLHVTVPYSYATIMTIVTYLVHTFCGNKPMFQVGSHQPETVERAPLMETVLQYNADHIKMIGKLYQYFVDGEIYGLQAMRCMWRVDNSMRTRWKDVPIGGILMPGGPTMKQQVREPVVTFEGNDVVNVDPYNFFPDPRVPMAEVSTRGEYVFWKHYEGRHVLKAAEDAGQIKWLKDVQPLEGGRRSTGDSARANIASGDGHAGPGFVDNVANSYELHQGTVNLVPKEWGLGDGESMERWLFTIANWNQIIQAEPLDADHGKHPVIVGEPYSTGYGFGNFGIADLLGPMQDTMSWLINSHMFNVRAVLNNELVVNPQMVDINDLKKRGPGRVIKMLPAAFGQDPKMAVQQLAVQDVTSSHIGDMQVVQRIGDMVSAINDNLRGQNQAGGRKTATEVRTSGESGASRLGAHAMLISAQSIAPLAEMMALNLQQNLTQAFYLKVVGADGLMKPLQVDPESLSGDFHYPIHDGTLPLDRVAMLDVWKEIFLAVSGNPLLAQRYDAGGIFEYLAKLGGAKNLVQFKVQPAAAEGLPGQVQAGNMVPVPGMMPGMPSGMLQ